MGTLRGATPRTRLGEFRLIGRPGPIIALALVSAMIYFLGSSSEILRLFLQLSAAFAVPFILLTGLAYVAGENTSWRLIIPIAGVGVVLGGVVSALIAIAPDWSALTVRDVPGSDFLMGAGFGAFFVGLSLVTSAVRQSEQAEYETDRRLLEARLKMLSARIEPHFLMNTLANLRYLVRSDAEAAQEMLDHISDFLRSALERSRDVESRLEQELQTVRSYLRIMQIRMGKKLNFEIDIPETCLPVPVPALILQTLVENCVEHGIDPSEAPGMISIRIEPEGDKVRVQVVDDGAGFDSKHASWGTGLRNVQDRLDTFYGGSASLAIESEPGNGTRVDLLIPGTN